MFIIIYVLLFVIVNFINSSYLLLKFYFLLLNIVYYISSFNKNILRRELKETFCLLIT